MNERSLVRTERVGEEWCLVQELRGPLTLPERQALISARGVSTVVEVQISERSGVVVERLPPGRTLASLAAARGPCPPRAAFEVGRQLSQVLRAAPEPHGGLNAACVYIDGEGKVSVCGFGFEQACRLEKDGLLPDVDGVRAIVVALCPASRHSLAAVDSTSVSADEGLRSLLEVGAGVEARSALAAWVRGPPANAMAALEVSAEPWPRETTDLLPFVTADTESSESRPGFDAGPSDLVGREVGAYRLARLVGAGAAGEVYEGRSVDGSRVAVKVLRSALSKARGSREARAAQAVRSPHVVRVLELGSVEGRPYVVMEFIDGEDLRQLLAREGKLDPQACRALFLQLLHGLAAIHRAGTVHRDVKPANILVSPRGLVLTDFGIARLSEIELTRLTRSGLLGTPRYMAPEQADSAHDVGPAADLYSAGVILYEMITGQPPFLGRSLPEVLAEHASQAPVSPPVAEGLGAIALELLQKDPLRRPTAPELLERMTRSSLTVPLPTVVRSPRPHGAAGWAGAVAVGLAVIALVGLDTVRGNGSAPAAGAKDAMPPQIVAVHRERAATTSTSEERSATAGPEASPSIRRPAHRAARALGEPRARPGAEGEPGPSKIAVPPDELSPSGLAARLGQAKVRLTALARSRDPSVTEPLEAQYLETSSRLRRAESAEDLRDVLMRLLRLEADLRVQERD